MDLRQLRYFVQVVERGGASAAADALEVAQSAISRAILSVERELGVRLFQRAGRSLQPTPAGRAFAARAAQIIRDVELAKQEVTASTRRVQGQMTVGLPPSLGPRFAPALLSESKRKWPALSLKLVESYSGYIHDWLIEKRVDIAVLNAEIAHGHDLVLTPFYRDEVVAVVPSGDAAAGKPIRFDRLIQRPLILPGHGHGLRRLIDRAAVARGKKPRDVVEIDSVFMIKELVIAGGYAAILPRPTVAREAEYGELEICRITQPSIKRELVLACARDRARDFTVQQLSQLMLSLTAVLA